MAKKTRQEHKLNLASDVIEPFAINLLGLMLEKGVVSHEEASKLIAEMKTDLGTLVAGSTDQDGAGSMIRRLDQLARHYGVTKPN